MTTNTTTTQALIEEHTDAIAVHTEHAASYPVGDRLRIANETAVRLHRQARWLLVRGYWHTGKKYTAAAEFAWVATCDTDPDA
jgi:hypothetical protein